MNPFKLFSINANCAACVLILTGCASQSAGIYRQPDREPFHQVQTYFTPHDKALSQVVGRQDPMNANPRQVFDAYCANGRSQRALETTIRAVLPRQPKGVAIDDAGKIHEETYKYFRAVAKSYYRLSLYSDTLRESKLTETPNVFAVKDPSLKACVEMAKASRANEKIPLTLLAINGSNTLLLGAMRLPTYAPVSYSGSEKGLFQWRESTGQPPIRTSVDVIFPKRPMRDENGKQLFPLYSSLPFEVLYFQKHFTMLIPEETQKQLFDKRAYFIREDGSFDLGQAVEKRVELWDSYVEAQTSLKEGQTDDPQIVDFQVNLDLNLFCRYGRFVNDLLTD